MTRAFSSLAVSLVRVATAVAYLVFSILLVSASGAEQAGVTLGAIAAVELAAVAGQLGVPVVLTRLRRLGGPGTGLPIGLLSCSAATAGVLGIVVAAAIAGFDPALVGIGAASVAVNSCLGGWHRGASQFIIGTLAHPSAAIFATTLAVAAGTAAPAAPTVDPLLAYAAGSMLTNVVLMVHLAGELRLSPARFMTDVREYAGSAGIGSAQIVSQAVVRGIPVLLVERGFKADAAVVSLALRAYRPLDIAQFAVGFTTGPVLAADDGRPLTVLQRQALGRATGLLQLAIAPYAVGGFVIVSLLGGGALTGEVLPALQATWLVLLAGYAMSVGTGPTNQLLLLRGRHRDALGAAVAGAVVSIVWFWLPLAPWLRAAGALSLGLVVQNGLNTLAAWRGEAWLASPAMAGRTAKQIARRAARATRATRATTSTNAVRHLSNISNMRR